MSSRVLAIETSTPHGHLALLLEGVVVFEERFISQRSHNSQLFAPLKKALEVANYEVDTLLVGTGPGSYTGVRIGISAAQGLATSLGAQVHGLSSALGMEEVDNVTFCGDARRGQFYVVALSQEGWPPEVKLCSEEEFRAQANQRQGRRWVTFDAKVPLGLPDVECMKPCAVALAKRFLAGNGGAVADREHQPLEPIYLSEAFITQAKPKVPTA